MLNFFVEKNTYRLRRACKAELVSEARICLVGVALDKIGD